MKEKRNKDNLKDHARNATYKSRLFSANPGCFSGKSRLRLVARSPRNPNPGRNSSSDPFSPSSS
jgi:hypothetical protein